MGNAYLLGVPCAEIIIYAYTYIVWFLRRYPPSSTPLAKSHAPKKMAPPIEIHRTRGPIPLKSAPVPSSATIPRIVETADCFY